MLTSSPTTCTSGTVPPGTTLATSKVQKATRVTKVIQAAGISKEQMLKNWFKDEVNDEKH